MLLVVWEKVEDTHVYSIVTIQEQVVMVVMVALVEWGRVTTKPIPMVLVVMVAEVPLVLLVLGGLVVLVAMVELMALLVAVELLAQQVLMAVSVMVLLVLVVHQAVRLVRQ